MCITLQGSLACTKYLHPISLTILLRPEKQHTCRRTLRMRLKREIANDPTSHVHALGLAHPLTQAWACGLAAAPRLAQMKCCQVPSRMFGLTWR